jgi:membrane protein YqaA with SNARE-associated domain
MFRRLYDWTLARAASPNAPVALGAVSFVESSVFPIPADVLFVPMVAARPEKAWTYALIATVTSVLGGVFGWLLAHFAFDLVAKPILEFYGKLAAFEAMRDKVADNHGLILLLLVTSGLSHLPPMKVVTLLSGFVGFDFWLFLVSAIIARGARFYALAWVLRRYGTEILHFIEKRLGLIAGIVVALAVVAWYFLKHRA